MLVEFLGQPVRDSLVLNPGLFHYKNMCFIMAASYTDARAMSIPSRRSRYIAPLFYRSVDVNMPWVSALLLWLLSIKLNGRGRKRILFLGSIISLDDIAAIIRYSGNYQYIHVKRIYLDYILRRFITCSDLRESNYYLDDKYLPGRQQTRQYFDRMFGHLRLCMGFHALMTTNIGYVEQQELLQTARRRRLPVVVLLKEGIVHPRNQEERFSSYENKRALCDRLFCYNDSIKEALINKEIPGLTRKNVKVTGMPRGDFYINESESRPSNQLAFFAFDTDAKFKGILNDEELEAAREITSALCEYIFELAANNSDLRVAIKTKPGKRRRKGMRDSARAFYGSNALPDNLTVTDTGLAKDLIMASKWVVVISSSTVLLEALLAKKCIACPDYTNIVEPGRWDFFSEIDTPSRSITYVSEYRHLEEFVGDCGEVDEAYEQARRTVLNRYIYKTDGNASRRVEDELVDLFSRERRHGAFQAQP